MVDPSRFTCADIHAPVSVESLESYEEHLSFYEDNNFTYIPLPLDEQYYDIDGGQLRSLEQDQYIDADRSLFAGLERLCEYPFLLTKDRPSYGYTVEDDDFALVSDLHGQNVWEFYESHPEYKQKLLELESGKRWHIITLADTNKRAVSMAVYSLLFELETGFASQIREAYPESEDLFEYAGDEAIQRWEDAQESDVEIHLTELMKLYELAEVIQDSEALYQRWGFDSKNQVDEILGGPISMRNEIMHPARRLVTDRDDLMQMVDRVHRLQRVLGSAAV